MKKMPCLFVREFHGRQSFTLLRQVTPGCEWALTSDAVATRKWDGTACAVIGGVLHKRYDAKRNPKTGEYKLPPMGAIPCDEPDAVTGHWPHWVPVGLEPESRWHREAWAVATAQCAPYPTMHDGTYELVGPAINGNPEARDTHSFERHGEQKYSWLSLAEVPNNVESIFSALREFFSSVNIEGIVFHHVSDGRMCKIRRADFGFAWGAKK